MAKSGRGGAPRIPKPPCTPEPPRVPPRPTPPGPGDHLRPDPLERLKKALDRGRRKKREKR